jgi:hypothetical protein
MDMGSFWPRDKFWIIAVLHHFPKAAGNCQRSEVSRKDAGSGLQAVLGRKVFGSEE